MYQSFQLISEKNKYFRDAKKLNKETCYAAIKGIRNLFRLKKKIKQLNTEYLEILEIFLSMKRENVMNQ